MSCCCMKIIKCQNEISKVSDAKTVLKTLKNNNDMLTADLSELSRKMHDMATPDNIGSCAAGIKNMNKDFASTIDGMIDKCTNKISDLKSDKEKYEKEDKEYHENLQ